MKRWLLVAAAFLFMLGPCRTMAAKPITSEEAMGIAEAFVAANGYTDAPASKSVADLDGESFERGGSREGWLAFRNGLMEGKAWGFRKGARSDQEGWCVIFRIKRKPDFQLEPAPTSYGKLVQMDRYGGNLIVLHGVTTAYDNTDFGGFIRRTKASASK